MPREALAVATRFYYRRFVHGDRVATAELFGHSTQLRQPRKAQRRKSGVTMKMIDAAHIVLAAALELAEVVVAIGISPSRNLLHDAHRGIACINEKRGIDYPTQVNESGFVELGSLITGYHVCQGMTIDMQTMSIGA
jgi:hypothetical protein